MSRRVSIATKKQIAGSQYFKCNNKPNSNLRGLENYNCPLWQINGENKGCFDRAGYEIDHVIEHCISKDDDMENLQALCIMCHSVKTKKFNIKNNKKKENHGLVVTNKNTKKITINNTQINKNIKEITQETKIDTKTQPNKIELKKIDTNSKIIKLTEELKLLTFSDVNFLYTVIIGKSSYYNSDKFEKLIVVLSTKIIMKKRNFSEHRCLGIRGIEFDKTYYLIIQLLNKLSSECINYIKKYLSNNNFKPTFITNYMCKTDTTKINKYIINACVEQSPFFGYSIAHPYLSNYNML